MSLPHFFRTVLMMGSFIGILGFLVSCDHYGATGGGGSNHVQEAISHSMEAVEHGNMGHGDQLATHASVALKHARMAQNESNNPHIGEAIGELDSAVSYGGMGLVGGGTKAAESAIVHLKQVN